MIQTFGDFRSDLPTSREYLVLGFSPSSVPLQQRWQNNGLSADFLADYLATFLPANQNNSEETDFKSELKSAVSFIANELLENAMKFNDEASTQPIGVSLQLYNDKIVFLVTNSISPQVAIKLQDFIQELTTSDPDELYIRNMEKSATSERESGLGFLTMINDYLAKVGWKFEKLIDQPPVIALTTMVELPIKTNKL